MNGRPRPLQSTGRRGYAPPRAGGSSLRLDAADIHYFKELFLASRFGRTRRNPLISWFLKGTAGSVSVSQGKVFAHSFVWEKTHTPRRRDQSLTAAAPTCSSGTNSSKHDALSLRHFRFYTAMKVK